MVIFLKELGIFISLMIVGFFIWLGNHLYTLEMMDLSIYIIGTVLWIFVSVVFCKMGYDILRNKDKSNKINN